MLSESDGYTCLKQRFPKDRLRFHSLRVKIFLFLRDCGEADEDFKNWYSGSENGNSIQMNVADELKDLIRRTTDEKCLIRQLC